MILSNEQEIDAMKALVNEKNGTYRCFDSGFFEYKLSNNTGWHHVINNDARQLAEKLNIDIMMLDNSPLGAIGKLQDQNDLINILKTLSNQGIGYPLPEKENSLRLATLLKEKGFHVEHNSIGTVVDKILHYNPQLKMLLSLQNGIKNISWVKNFIETQNKLGIVFYKRNIRGLGRLPPGKLVTRKGFVLFDDPDFILDKISLYANQHANEFDTFVSAVHAFCYQNQLSISMFSEGDSSTPEVLSPEIRARLTYAWELYTHAHYNKFKHTINQLTFRYVDINKLTNTNLENPETLIKIREKLALTKIKTTKNKDETPQLNLVKVKKNIQNKESIILGFNKP